MYNVQFVSRYKIWFAISAALVAVALGALLIKGMNFSLEFTGGTSITWKFDKTISVEQIRQELGKFGLGGAASIIQPVGEAGQNEFLIRTRPLQVACGEDASSECIEQDVVLQGIEKDLGGQRQNVLTVGPAWGAQVTQSALIALVLSLIAILLYVTIRFEYKMAVSAIVALLHDVIIAIGIYALVGREVSPATIAAFLTVLGYSLYDTIIVFHRILENSKGLTRKTYSQMVNASENQVLVRSTNTAITTLLPVVAILLFGGETLKDFAFALLVGILPGAYSSLFLASPLLARWKEKEQRYQALARKVAAIESGEERPKFKRKKAGDAGSEPVQAEAPTSAEEAAEQVDKGEGLAQPKAAQQRKPVKKPKKKKKR